MGGAKLLDEKEIADRVRDAANKLNSAMGLAQDAGLAVDINVTRAGLAADRIERVYVELVIIKDGIGKI
jgi:hypothetical protein